MAYSRLALTRIPIPLHLVHLRRICSSEQTEIARSSFSTSFQTRKDSWKHLELYGSLVSIFDAKPKRFGNSSQYTVKLNGCSGTSYKSQRTGVRHCTGWRNDRNPNVHNICDSDRWAARLDYSCVSYELSVDFPYRKID